MTRQLQCALSPCARQSMTCFPCVTDDGKVILVQIALLYKAMDGVEYCAFRDDDEEGSNGVAYQIQADKRLLNGTDSYSSLLEAISTSRNKGFLTIVSQLPNKRITGASFGLAVAVECCRPGKFPGVAFTGFVSNMNEDDGTYRIHEIDNVLAKIAGCRKAGVPLIVPYNEQVSTVKRNIVTPKDVCRGLTEEDYMCTTWAAYSLLEAMVMADMTSKIRRG